MLPMVTFPYPNLRRPLLCNEEVATAFQQNSHTTAFFPALHTCVSDNENELFTTIITSIFTPLVGHTCPYVRLFSRHNRWLTTVQTIRILVYSTHKNDLQSVHMEEGIWTPTSFWSGKAFVQVKNYFFHKVLNVAVLRSPNKNHPIVREALRSGFLPDLGTVAEFQFHLDGTLRDANKNLL